MKPALPFSSRLRPILVVVALLACGPDRAQAQYTTAPGFEVSWTLDPRAFPTVFTRGPGFGARGVLVGMDFDADGKKEFLFTTDETLAPQGPAPGQLDVFLYENTGNDQYEHVWHYTHPEGSNSLPPLEWGDMDEDGLFEIYLGIPTIDDAAKLFIFEQNPDKTFPAEPTVAYDYGRAAELDFRPAAFALGDVDGDGQIELATTSRTSGRRELVVISPLSGIDAFTVFDIEFEAGEDLLSGGAIYDVDIVDFDADGRNEIWVNTWDRLSMTVFEATGADAYALQVDINQVDPVVDHGSVEAIRFVDIDGDEKLELIWPSTEGSMIFLDDLADVSTLAPEDFRVFAEFTPGSSRGADVGDLDGDDLLDIVINTQFDEQIIWAEYDGSGDPADSSSYTWTEILAAPDTSTGRWYPLRIADDLDGDGRNEIVIPNLAATGAEQHLIIILEAEREGTAVEEETLPTGYVLHQNFPNPFNPETQIVFETAAAGPVRLAVYDVAGREVGVLVDGALPAGRHEVSFRAGSLPSGLYLIRMTTPHGVITRKATLLR